MFLKKIVIFLDVPSTCIKVRTFYLTFKAHEAQSLFERPFVLKPTDGESGNKRQRGAVCVQNTANRETLLWRQLL